MKIPMRSVLWAAAVLGAVLVLPSTGRAQSTADLQAQISALLAELHALQAALGNSTSSSAPFCHTFDIDLGLGDGGAGSAQALVDDVRALHTILGKEGFAAGSDDIGNGVFGPSTKIAVAGFQSAHGIRRTGFVGPLTRGELNRDYGCAAVSSQGTGAAAASVSVEAPSGITVQNGAADTGVSPVLVQYTIHSFPYPEQGFVDLLLLQNGALLGTIASHVPAGGSASWSPDALPGLFTWAPPLSYTDASGTVQALPDGAGYRVKAVLKDAAGNLISSAAAGASFSVSSLAAAPAAPTSTAPVAVTSASTTSFAVFLAPQGGETYQKGQIYKLSWLWSASSSASFSYFSTLTVALTGGRLGGGATRILGSTPPASNYGFSWSVPTDVPDGSGYQIQFFPMNSTTSVAWSPSFSLVTPGLPVQANTSPITILTPLAGDAYALGGPLLVSWTPVWQTASAVKLVNASTSQSQTLYAPVYAGNNRNYMSYALPTASASIAPGEYYIDVTPSAGGPDATSSIFAITPASARAIAAAKAMYAVTGFVNAQSAYSTPGTIQVGAKALEPDGTPASPAEGFVLRTVLTDTANPGRFYPNQDVRGVYDSAANVWSASFPAPADPALTYDLSFVLSCDGYFSSSTCMTKYGSGSQASVDTIFTVATTTPASTATSTGPSISFVSPANGDVYVKGQQIRSSWTWSGTAPGGAFTVSLGGGGLASPRTLGIVPTNVTSFSWTVPLDVPDSVGYNLELLGGPSVPGTASPYFSILTTTSTSSLAPGDASVAGPVQESPARGGSGVPAPSEVALAQSRLANALLLLGHTLQEFSAWLRSF